MDSGNPVGWFEIYVDQMDRARRFYESVFDTTLERLDGPEGTDLEMWSFPSETEMHGTGGSLVKASGMPAGGNSTVVYFTCADCAVQEARVAPAGGRVERSKMSIGQYGFVSIVFDTEGNLFGLHSLK